VLRDNDPTAHAEVNAIREACKILGTYDLTGCELYATGYPCPMCMSAIIWANIKKVYVSGLAWDAAEIGFRDDFIYKFIQDGCTDIKIMEIENLNSTPARELYKQYAEQNHIIY
jgi:tRNA(Arg) A34 adenosine deaminase TadA